jgi:DNA-binding PadR family transcriptional regulator
MLGETPMGRRDRLSGLGYSKRTGNYVRALENLQNAHLIEMTLPGKPNSRLQKYRLTDKGRKRIEE